jgi:exodeoxyribonuclease VII small subunit
MFGRARRLQKLFYSCLGAARGLGDEASPFRRLDPSAIGSRVPSDPRSRWLLTLRLPLPLRAVFAFPVMSDALFSRSPRLTLASDARDAAHAHDAAGAPEAASTETTAAAPDGAAPADANREPDRPSLEHSMHALEEIVERLENDPPDLESAIDAYEKGVAIARECLRRLEHAEQRVTTLSLRDE